jgi:hypothetical protein
MDTIEVSQEGIYKTDLHLLVEIHTGILFYFHTAVYNTNRNKFHSVPLTI